VWGLKKKLQIEKKKMVAKSRTVVSAVLDAFGNLVRRKRSVPNSASKRILSQPSSAEFMRLHNVRPELKKSHKSREDFVKLKRCDGSCTEAADQA
jgi:hypothetical protein